jgi:acetylornithine deacetylase/succinyl-diaminopimelate desuccinylase-like protein
VRERVEAHLRSRGYHVVHEAPDAATRAAHEKVAFVRWEAGYGPLRVSPALPVSRAIVRVASEAAGAPVIELPMLGGSLPLATFDEVIDAPVIVIPIANHDNNQHAANENLRVKNLRDAIELYAFMIARLGIAWH